MQLLTDLKYFKPDPAKPLILGLGNFDGLHKGHQALLGHVVKEARLRGGKAAVLTFKEHPQRILHPDKKPSLLMSNEQRLYFLNRSGIEICAWLPFTEAFSRIDPDFFVEELLVKSLRVREVCMGYNAHFGHKRKGDVGRMHQLAARFGFEFTEIPPIRVRDDFVSSTRIRSLVQEGNLEEVEACLGRRFSLFGKVVKGAGRGKKIGFPTANLSVENAILPPTGVYSVKVRTLLTEHRLTGRALEAWSVKEEGPWQAGVLNCGRRPTFEKQGGNLTLEVFILDPAETDLYGCTLEVAFHARIREEKTFPDPEALAAQIRQDVGEARRYFSFTKEAP